MKPIDRLSDAELVDLARRAGELLPDAPPALVRRAIALWPAPAAPSALASAQTLLRRVVGVLTFDSGAAPSLAFGMRSIAGEGTRHLLFSAADRDVDLRITAGERGYALSGQVLGPDESGSVELVANQGDPAGGRAHPPASLDELGEFRFDAVDAGTYALTLRFGADEIVLQPIVIGTAGT